MQESCVTTVITTYNRPKLVRRAIQSVFNQTHKPYLIISDNGNCLNDIRDILPGWGYEYIQTGINEWPIVGWLIGLSKVKTKYVSILHDDDWYEPEFIETMLSMMRDDVGFCFSNAKVNLDGQSGLNLPLRTNQAVKYYTADEMERIFISLTLCITPATCFLRTKDAVKNLIVNQPMLSGAEPLAGPDKLLTMLTLLDYKYSAFCNRSLVNLDGDSGSITTESKKTVDGKKRLIDAYEHATLLYFKLKELKLFYEEYERNHGSNRV